LVGCARSDKHMEFVNINGESSQSLEVSGFCDEVSFQKIRLIKKNAIVFRRYETACILLIGDKGSEDE